MKKLLALSLLFSCSVAWAQIDPNEYATGNLTAQQQLQSYPLPRFKTGHTLNRNFIWFGIEYFSGLMQPNLTRPQIVNLAKTNAVEFHNNWNYYFPVSSNIGTYSTPAFYADTVNTFSAALTNVAKRNPSFKTSAICFWAQIGGNVSSSSLSNLHYLQNSSGQFLDLNGNVTSSKIWSPLAPNSSIAADGVKQRGFLQNLVTALGRPVDILNENGEILPLLNKNGNAISRDPRLAADKPILGNLTPTNYDYIGHRFAAQTKLYRDSLLKASPTTIFTHYAMDGQTDYRPAWNKSRDVNSKINGRYYPTGDFYPRWPSNWRSWAGAWHGLGWFADCKYFELQAGDSLMSPFVCAGWNIDETKNLRPAQYLATLKILSAWGSEFFYSGYFSLSAPFPDPKNWGWQAVMPVYAQGITSRYEEYLKAGTLLNGDVPRNYLGSTTLWPNNPKYLFNTGDTRQLVAVRKLNNSNKYVITTAQMVDANTPGNAPMVSFGKFKLGNDSLFVTFRRQGSVYIYDASNPSSRVFYQLDGWHQYEHPERWSSNLHFEAELFDNSTSGAVIKTEVPAGTAPGDYRNYTSYVTFNNTAQPVQYNFNARKSTTYNFWVKARSKNATGGSLIVSVTGQTQKMIGCINNTSWRWYSIDANTRQPISYSGLQNQNYLLSLLATNTNIEIDSILLTPNTLNLNPNQPICLAGSGPVITGSPSFTACEGDTITLTSSQANSYLWSNGSTTQSITVNATGTYTLTVTDSSGTFTSPPVAVTLHPLPSSTINHTGSLDLCPGKSTTLNCSATGSFRWSNGATTSSINVNSAGSYVVTVTDQNGCTSVSQPVSVTQIPVATVSIIHSSPLSFCPGGNVTLTASTGGPYLWSNNATTASITATNSGNYSVTVTHPSGCTSVSAPVSVSWLSNPTATITSNGPSAICNGTPVTLNASSGATHLWSNGATTASITVNTPGTYSVTVTQSNSCSSASVPIAVTSSAITAPVISMTGSGIICPGQSVLLNSNASGTLTYRWSNGATTPSINVSSGGNFSLRITEPGGCTAVSNSISITQLSAPQPSITLSNPAICNGGSVSLSVPGALNITSYQWSTGASTSSITTSSPGNFNVTVTYGNGCTATSSGQNITVRTAQKPLISTNGQDTLICPGESVTLTSTISSSGYLWSNGETTRSITVSNPAQFTVQATDSYGCTGISDLRTIVSESEPEFDLTISGPLTFCSGQNVIFDVINSNATSYVWFKDGRPVFSGLDASYPVASPGEYKLMGVLGNCTSSSKAYKVSILPCWDAGDNSDQTRLMAYPNPADDHTVITIESTEEGPVSLRILDASGHLVEEITSDKWLPSGKTQIPHSVSHLANGYYIIEAITIHGIQRMRLVTTR